MTSIDDILGGASIPCDEAHRTMASVLAGGMEPARLAGLLVALRAKGPSVDELVGFATAMREASTRINAGPCLDNCGTGGAKHKTLNISTTAAFVIAADGVTVAKHGNRSITRPSGSADILETAGANLDAPPARVEQILRDVGIAFLFAPRFHPAMRHAGPVRQALGMPTVFNMLGPLTNPAGATHQVLGVGQPDQAQLMAESLERLGCQRGLVLHGSGYDEATPTGPSEGFLVSPGRIEPWSWHPPAPACAREDLLPVPKEQALDQLTGILAGSVDGPVRDTVALNAGLGLWVAGRASDEEAGYEKALSLLDGAGKKKWDAFVEATNA